MDQKKAKYTFKGTFFVIITSVETTQCAAGEYWSAELFVPLCPAFNGIVYHCPYLQDWADTYTHRLLHTFIYRTLALMIQ